MPKSTLPTPSPLPTPYSLHPTLLVIVGPTASGKSALAIKIAKEFNGEIICADSRTVYKDMNIGTAKPTALDQAEVMHWALDLVKPGERFSAAKFKQYAKAKIIDIQNRGNLPILVGGTGLYIDSVIYDFEFQGDVRPQERAKLEKLTTDQLRAKIKHMGIKMPHNDKNQRHLVRTIERKGQGGGRQPLSTGVIQIGLNPPDDVLRTNISKRAEVMFDNGIVAETHNLVNKYGREELLKTAGIIYKLALKLIDEEVNIDEAKELNKTADWQYARRQRTWFKRNQDIQWFSSVSAAHNFLKKQLST